MNSERYKHLMGDVTEPLTKEELSLGWHFCQEFDGLLVGPTMPESEWCDCVVSRRTP